ncbi:MAG: DEAD/DEAH box helicase family protein [bacterium]
MIELAREVEKAVSRWRKRDYEGTSKVTKRLLNYWFKEDHYFDDARQFEFWRCQREAMESLIYVYEVSEYHSLYQLSQGFSVGMMFDPTLDRWPRYCFRMATGSGKTFVMGLSLVWQYFNSIYGTDGSDEYSRHFLLVAPNLIVLDRLRDFEDNRIFHDWPFFIPPDWEADFDLQVVIQTEDVPAHSRGVLHITNVQQFYERGNDEPGNPIQEVLGTRPTSGEEFKSRATLYDILGRYEDLMVLNDEAHHAHPETEWWGAMEKLDAQLDDPREHGLTMQLDFSATPMDADGYLFPHVFYDYPLGQAIDDEIVKRPHIGTITGVPAPIGDSFVRQNQIQIDEGVELLKRKKEELSDTGEKPVLFIMCDRNANADRVGAYLENEKGYKGKVLVIHTYQRKTRTGFLAGDIRKDELPKLRKAAKNIDTNEYEIIVSVMMLKEGWDVRNVTAIVPLRAYESKILVEQTLGRGLRRMFPENEDLVEKLIVVEHPSFRELWEAQIRDKGLDIEISSLGDAYEPSNKVSADESKLEYDFEIPLVRGGITQVTPNLSELDLRSLPQAAFSYDKVEIPTPRYIEKDLVTHEITDEREIQFDYTDRHEEYLAYLTKAILYRVGSASQFSDLVPLVKRYIENFLFDINADITDSEVIKKLNHRYIRHHIKDHFVSALRNLATIESDYRVVSGYRLSDTPVVHTSNPVLAARKTVFEVLPYPKRTTYEREFMVYLDSQPEVLAYTKVLSRFPLRIPYYDKDGILHHYLPDFIVKARDGKLYLIETKGKGFGEMESVKLKDKSARNWCKRVSELTDDEWVYAKVGREDFEQYKGLGFSGLVEGIVPPALL